MFKNYLTIALRNIKKHKGYSLINITGLAIGMAVCILIFLFVEYELGFDSHFSQKENIYRVVTHTHRAEGTEYAGSTPFPTAAALRNDFPDLKYTTQCYRESDALITVGDRRFKENDILFVEPLFFELFDAQWIQGDASKALDDPNAVILTEQLAHKYFGDSEAIGSILKLDNEFELHVTGVVANAPRRTSLSYGMLISWGTLDEYLDNDLDQWDIIWGTSHTYLKLSKAVDTKSLENRFEAFEQKYMEPDYAEKWSFRLQSTTDIHFDTRYASYNYVTSRTTLFVISTIGFVILFIACINFINLTTAQAMRRAKEMGMRKVLGADRGQLVRQLLGETSLFTFFSILIALFLAWSVLPYLNQFLGKNTELSFLAEGKLFLFLGIVYLFVSSLNGLYPAFVLSHYRPVEALKERVTSHRKRSYTIRNSLVLTQFIISQVLIVGTLVIASQMKFMSRMDLGFRKQGILMVPTPDYKKLHSETLRSRWLRNPHIQEVSFAWSAPTSRSNFRTPFVYEASNDIMEYPVYIKMCDKRYRDIYEIPLIAGRFFERNANDTTNKQWVVNEAVVARMGLSDPQQAIGKRVTVNDLEGEIIGVIGDFHVRSLRAEIQPTVFFNFWPENHREAQIKIHLENVRETIKYIEEVWTENFPEYLFEYTFLDDYLKSLYDTETRLLTMIQGASFLAILIGCLGLLGLVSFMVLQRTKEIGVRKVLGARVGQLVLTLSRDFFILVVLANIIAWPLAYYVMHQWLQNFAYRINIAWWIFVLAGTMAMAVTLITVSYQSIKAALANPVESLRYE